MNPEATGSSFELQINQAITLLSGVWGAVAVLAVLAIALGVYLFKPARWLAIALLLDVSSFASFEFTGNSIMTPLSQMRQYGRAICAALLISLLVPTFLTAKGWRFRSIIPAMSAFIVYEVVMAVRVDDMGRLVFDILTFGLIFTTLGLGISRWVQSLEEADWAVFSVAWAGILFMFGCSVQLVKDASQVSWNGRFLGTTGNPNHAGALLAITLLPILYLALRPKAPPSSRVFYASWAIADVFFLLWTGSRTGLLMATVGIVVQFRKRLVASAAVAVIGGFAVAITFYSFSNSLSDSHGFSTANTRSAQWGGMIQNFFSSPLIGVGNEAGFSESSYLVTAARAGLFGLIPLGIMLVFTYVTLRRIQRSRSHLQQFVSLSDLALAAITAELVGGIFEGFLYGTYTLPVLSMYIFLSIAAFLLDVDTVATSDVVVDFDAVDYPVDSQYETAGHMSHAHG